MKKNLTLRYALHHFAYWAAAAGIMSFATAYLLYKGFAPGKVGTLMACGTILSCITQPLLASMADKAKKPILPKLMALLSLLSTICFALLLTGILPNSLFPFLYLGGVWAFDAMIPLLNSISVYYNRRGYTINYGMGRGLGSIAYALSALVIGYVMEELGADWMIRIILVLLPLMILLVLGYPRVSEEEHAVSDLDDVESAPQPCSIPVFFRRYKWYCASLIGVLFLAMFHSMTENYLIAIMGRLGGDSSHVGVALSIATVAEAFIMFFFSRIRGAIRDTWLLKISGFCFLLKSVLFIIAPSIPFLYATQLLQMTTYAFLSPVTVFYASGKVAPADMVKGQAFIAAAYTLGCAGGNFFGGQFMQRWGVDVLLTAGVVMAAIGTLAFLITVERKDAWLTEHKGETA